MLNNNSESTTARQSGARYASFKEMCKEVGFNHVEIAVHSYGYMTGGVFGHFEPFKTKRTFTFILDWFDELDDQMFWLYPKGNGFLNFVREENESFYLDEQGRWHCDDPELVDNPDDDV